MLTHEARPAGTIGNGGSSAAALTESFAYDGLGRRIQQWNSQLGSTVKQTTDYDLEGRVSKTTTFGGHSTLYAYAWSGTLATTGLGTFGGWVKTTTHVSGRTASDSEDYFGRTVARTGLGWTSYSFTFDKAGRLTQQTNSVGQNIVNTYFSTGRLKSVTDTSAGTAANYVYDAAGNRTYEDYTVTVTTSVYEHEIGWVQQTHTEARQATSATYDALNRLLTANDSLNGVSVANEYDLNGNVRRIEADYADPLGGSTPKEQVYWYRYDALNRFSTAKGLLSGARGSGTIVRGEQGVDLTYDAAGNRKTATTSRTVTEDLWTTYYDGVEIYDITVSRTYLKDRIETYDYTADRYLEKVSIAETHYDVNTSTTAMGSAVVRAKDARDLMGRVTAHTEYADDGATVAYSRVATYNADSLVTTDTVSTRQADGKTKKAVNTYLYTEYLGGAQSSAASYGGAYTGGAVTGTITANSKIALNGTETTDPATSQRVAYAWWDDPRQGTIHHQTGTATPLQTTLTYDTSGRLKTAFVNDGTQRTVTYDTDPTGQVMRRVETSTTRSGTPTDKYFYIDGIKFGETSNNGTVEATDYASAINQRSATQTSSNLYRYGSAKAFADFDQAYEAVTPSSARATASTYVARDGDTLQSIAEAVWGDSSLWWMIAESNGLTSADAVTGGMTLEIPNRVSNFHNTDETFKPYDPNKAIGDLVPNVPKPPRQNKSCGGLGVILMIIVAVVVTVVTYGALTSGASTFLGSLGTSLGGAGFATGAVAGAAGSIASQVVGLATGTIEKFSWSAVALSALSAGVVKGLGEWSGFTSALDKITGGNAVVAGGLRAATASVITQGVGTLTGLQDEFSWTAVAVAGAAGAAGDWAAGKMVAAGFAPDAWQTGAAAGAAGAIAGSAAQSLIDGSDFGDNVLAALPTVIGTTIGGMIAAKVAGPPKLKFAELEQGSGGGGESYDVSVKDDKGKQYDLTVTREDGNEDVVNIYLNDFQDPHGNVAVVPVGVSDPKTYDIRPVVLKAGTKSDYDLASGGGTGLAAFWRGSNEPINASYVSYLQLIRGYYAGQGHQPTYVGAGYGPILAASGQERVEVAAYENEYVEASQPQLDLTYIPADSFAIAADDSFAIPDAVQAHRNDSAWIRGWLNTSPVERLKSEGPARYDPHASFVENGATYQWRDTGNAMRKERVQLAGVYDPEADAARRRNMDMIGLSFVSPSASIRGGAGYLLGESDESRHAAMTRWGNVDAVVLGLGGARLNPRPSLRPTAPTHVPARQNDVPQPTRVSYARPSGYRAGVRDEVWENAIRSSPDGVVRDPLSGRVMLKDEPWDMGHRPGHEFRRMQANARTLGISRKEFLDIHNNPKLYRPELPASNRSHKLEDQSPY